MLPDTLYEFSLICTMVATITYGLTLLFIGNAKVMHSHHLKRVKLFFSILMLLIGITVALQWLMRLSIVNPLAEAALNITLLATGFLLIFLAFFPLVSPIRLTKLRQFIIFTTFFAYIILLWTSLTLSPTLSRIILFISIGLFFFELVRVNIVFFYNYKTLSESHPEPGSEDEKRWIFLNSNKNTFIVLSVSAALCVPFVVWIPQYKAIYQLLMLLVLGYLFVKIVNAIITLNYLSINNIRTKQSLSGPAKKSNTHEEMSSKVNQWVEKGGYRVQGITLKQVAQEMTTDPVYLSQYINTHYGCNFKTWITRLRVNHAKQLLGTTSITIDMVAARAGFSNKAQFTTAFKTHEGCTPGVWRQQRQN